MKNNIEFQKIGKKTPFKAPAGFFETISEKTLQKAKQRENSRRKSIILWRTLAVAASLAAVFYIGYVVQDSTVKPKSDLMVVEKLPIIRQVPEIAKPIVSEMKKALPEKTIVEEKETEIINDVLADMSDEELQQLAAMYKTDPFIGESDQ